MNRYASDDDHDDIDIDGRDSNGNMVGGYGSCYDRGDYSTDSYDYEPTYLYKFKTKEALITSPVFQEMLGKALEHKDKIIRDLQNELLNREFS